MGPKNFYVLRQELFSLKNQQGAIRGKKEREEFEKKLIQKVGEIDKMLDGMQRDELYRHVDAMLGTADRGV